MNKKIVAGGLVLISFGLVGCQNMTDQLGSKIAESVINSSTKGEVKVDLDDLQNGKINVTTKEGTIAVNGGENGGSLIMTDKNGSTTSYKADSGNVRSEDAPEDMPSLSEGKDFGYFTTGDMHSLSFSVESADMKAICEKEAGLIAGAGWQVSTDGFNLEAEDGIAKNYDKGDDTLILACGKNEGVITIGLQKAKKSK